MDLRKSIEDLVSASWAKFSARLPAPGERASRKLFRVTLNVRECNQDLTDDNVKK